MFKEDQEVVIRELSYIWVSAGLIPRNGHKIPEDIAEDYLLELINRNMVQVATRRLDNGVKTFTMHDLIRDMCLRLGDRENFLKVINEESSTYEQYHHICIDLNLYNFTPRSFGLHIRGLFCHLIEGLSLVTSSMKRLRVLELTSFNDEYRSSALKFLVQLRHLECDENLSDFESHVNLEFLSVRKLPEKHIQLNMPKLRHLHLDDRDVYSDHPRHFHLKYLHISQTNSLETLSGIIIENLEDEERLRCFSNLHCLECVYNTSLKDSADFSSFTQLAYLHVDGSELIRFKTINYPTHIKKLCLSNIVLSCGLLSSIGKLSHLETLKLCFVEIEEMIWNTKDDEFQILKFLGLYEVGLKEWNVSEDHFPILEQLMLAQCSGSKLLPSNLGYIPTLQRLEVSQCTKYIRNSAKHIQEEQEEAGNEQLQVIISGQYWDRSSKEFL